MGSTSDTASSSSMSSDISSEDGSSKKELTSSPPTPEAINGCNKVTWKDEQAGMLLKKNLSKFGIVNTNFDPEKGSSGSFILRSSSNESLDSSGLPFKLNPNRPRSVSVVMPTSSEIKITWNQLTFDVSKYVWEYEDTYLPTRTFIEKRILKPQSGEIRAGTLTGLMGPSGAGKSTLLNCITGRNSSGVGGEVLVTYPSDRKYINIAFVPQKDHLFAQFTVRETIRFASKVKNPRDIDHESEVDAVIHALNLESCADTKVSKCSGGQVKRVSIGVELVTHPDMLVLDEPTSGLDSTTAETCVKLLRNLTMNSGPGIVCTIHQPNYEIFNYFHQIYILSYQGENIYCGPPTNVMDFFSSFDIRKPEYVNPADYAMDVASGKFCSSDLFKRMAQHQLKLAEGDEITTIVNNNYRKASNVTALSHISTISGFTRTATIGKMLSKTKNQTVPSWYQTWLLFWRSIQVSCFRSKQLTARCIMNLIIGGLVAFMFSDPPGVENGCWSDGLSSQAINHSLSESEQLREQVLNSVGNSKDAKAAYIAKISRITDNTNFVFAVCTYVLMTYSIATVLIIPFELATAVKEISNSWYKASSYFIAKSVADIIPLFLSISVAIVIVYFVTEQINETWRFLTNALIIILLAWACESVGMLIGIILSSDLTAATLVTMAAAFPHLIYSGYLVRIAAIPWFFKPLTYLSYVRFAFEGQLVTLYGWGRCAGGKKTADFVDNLVAANNPIDLITNLWESFNITSTDTRRFAALINTDDQCMESVVNGTAEYLGFNLDGSPITEPGVIGDSNSSEDDESFQPSYVLSYFKLENETLFQSITALFIMITVVRILTFTALHLKTRVRY